MTQTEFTDIRKREAGHWLAVLGTAVALWACVSWVLDEAPKNLPDFSRFERPVELKKAFFDYMEPVVEAQADRVRKQRDMVLTIADRFESSGELSFYHRWRLDGLARQYRVPEDLPVKEKIEALRQRVDVVPLELALVQAAKESAWGRSRFAIRANNLFGHWCFDPGCGLVPQDRAAGKKHQLKTYDSVGDAIANYMHNLNTHPRYLRFRQLRTQLRESGEEVTGIKVADGLLYYSERRQTYIREVKAMIRQYRNFVRERDGNRGALKI